MKLISLNCWGGKVFEPLMDFIRLHAKNTDIFCLQEVYNTTSDVKQYKNIIRANLLQELKKVLPYFQVFYSVEISGFDSAPNPVNFNLTVGKATFVKNNIDIRSEDDLLFYGDRDEKNLRKDFSNLAVTLQLVEFTIKDKQYTICNFHGTSFPGSKLDTPLRLKQSTEILDFLNNKTGSKIIAGDFNLLPQTGSIRMLDANFRNLIKEFNIERTRSDLSPYAGRSDFQKYADYIFVSEGVNVKSFQVPQINIADHLPMILEFD